MQRLKKETDELKAAAAMHVDARDQRLRRFEVS